MISPEEDHNLRTYFPIRNYQYDQWFKTVQYKEKTLNEEEKAEFVKVIDETVSLFASGLPLFTNELNRLADSDDVFHRLYRTICSVSLFVLMTMCDCMVAGKYFILADTDYDRRFMRGKMKVILNEGFKKLYGFKGTKNNTKTPEWFRLLDYMKYFPENIKLQYRYLTNLLDNQSKSSSWWKEERDYETHIDSEKLYESRMVDIRESKEMMETLQLYNALFAVNHFLGNAHAYLTNILVDEYRRGELKEE